METIITILVSIVSIFNLLAINSNLTPEQQVQIVKLSTDTSQVINSFQSPKQTVQVQKIPSFGSTQTISTPTEIFVNNQSGVVNITPNGCIRSGRMTCGNIKVKWHADNANQCGIVSDNQGLGWEGNFGTSGTKDGFVGFGTTTITIRCDDQSISTVQTVM